MGAFVLGYHEHPLPGLVFLGFFKTSWSHPTLPQRRHQGVNISVAPEGKKKRSQVQGLGGLKRASLTHAMRAILPILMHPSQTWVY